MKKSKKGLIACSYLLVSLNLYALDYNLELNTGFDSNPLALADSFAPESDQYTELDLRLRHEIAEGLRATIQFKKQSFLDQDAADSQAAAVKLDYAFDSKLMTRKVIYRFDTEYNSSDNTYVSKNIGRIGENNSGNPIPDRYDSNWFDYRARADIELTDYTRLDLNLLGRSKSYEDLSSLGLSSLGYSQWLFEPELRYSSDESNLFTAKTIVGSRSYDNRNGRDLTGVFVPNTQLEYDFIGFKFGWRYRPSDTQQFRISYNYEAREDNVSGYFDSTDNQLSLRYRYNISDKQELSLGVSYTDFSYDNSVNVAQSESEEAIYTKDGFNVSASYGYLWSRTDYGNWWLTTSVGHESYGSVSPNYEYDQSQFSIGIKLEL